MKKEICSELELENLRHNNRLIEIKFERDCKKEIEDLKHNNEMELQRVRSSEIKKTLWLHKK